MTKIALTAAAALLVATGAAFAGSDHFDPNANQPAVSAPAGNVDNSVTGSIRSFEQRDLHITPDQNQRESGQGIWGR